MNLVYATVSTMETLASGETVSGRSTRDASALRAVEATFTPAGCQSGHG